MNTFFYFITMRVILEHFFLILVLRTCSSLTSFGSSPEAWKKSMNKRSASHKGMMGDDPSAANSNHVDDGDDSPGWEQQLQQEIQQQILAQTTGGQMPDLTTTVVPHLKKKKKHQQQQQQSGMLHQHHHQQQKKQQQYQQQQQQQEPQAQQMRPPTTQQPPSPTSSSGSRGSSISSEGQTPSPPPPPYDPCPQQHFTCEKYFEQQQQLLDKGPPLVCTSEREVCLPANYSKFQLPNRGKQTVVSIGEIIRSTIPIIYLAIFLLLCLFVYRYTKWNSLKWAYFPGNNIAITFPPLANIRISGYRVLLELDFFPFTRICILG